MHFIASGVLALIPVLLHSATAQVSDSSGYTDYSLKLSGDPDSVIYETASTDTSNGTLSGPPDVYLNASVHVGELDILVQSLSAKINLDAEVLNLLTFNAGVNVEIGQVKLQIQNVTAEVELEVRLENLVKMIDDVLDSVDLNPVIAELGSSVGTIAGDVGSALGSSSASSAPNSRTTTSTANSGASNNTAGSSLSGRSQITLQQQILYSLNDYSGNTHTNRVLERNGDIVDQSLDNDGHIYTSKVVGTYQTLMQKVGSPKSGVIVDGMPATQQEYVYVPSHLGSFGLEVVCYVYTGSDGEVIAATVVAEVEGGGYSTISDTTENDD